MELKTSLFVVRDEKAEVHCRVVNQRSIKQQLGVYLLHSM
jgi:hypothetical protein